MARPRLLRRLDEGSAGPVTLVTAPAGWGKTTLLASWVRLGGGAADAEPGAVVPDSGQLSVAAAAGPVSAWVSVEVGDDGNRLWAHLAAAVRSATGLAEDGPVPDRAPALTRRSCWPPRSPPRTGRCCWSWTTCTGSPTRQH